MITSMCVKFKWSDGAPWRYGGGGAWLKNNKRKRQILQLTTAHYLKLYIIHEYTSIWHTYVVVYTNRHSMDSIVYDVPLGTWPVGSGLWPGRWRGHHSTLGKLTAIVCKSAVARGQAMHSL